MLGQLPVSLKPRVVTLVTRLVCSWGVTTTTSTLAQYARYCYLTTTDEAGKVSFENVRTCEYGLFAWPGEGSPVGDITTNFT